MGPTGKAVGLGLALLGTAVLLSALIDHLGDRATMPGPPDIADPALALGGAAVAALGFIGRRWIVRRFLERRQLERRVFTQRRRAEPPPPNFHGE